MLEEQYMKIARLLTIATIISAFATAGFAGDCCKKKKECDAPKEDKPATEQSVQQ